MALITKPDFTYVWASGGAIVAPNDSKKQLGWVAEAPPFQYDNWLQNRQDQMLAHINQRGMCAWDGLTNYEAGGLSYVQGSDGKIYKSVAASGPATTVQDPTTDTIDTYWTVAFADVGAFLTQADGDIRYTRRSNNLSDLSNASTAFSNIKQLASETATGVVELASLAEMATGASTSLVPTVAGVMSLFNKRAFAVNDFIRIPDVSGGLIIQWGKATLTAGAEFTTITFPITFPIGALSVVASPADNVGRATIEAEELGTVTATNFQAAVLTTGGAGSNTNLHWIAIGY